MAHFIYEYSANIPAELLDIAELMRKLHTAAADSGVFPLAGIRSRAIRCDEYRVADGDPEHGFVNLSMKVGRGRALALRMELGQTLFDLMVAHLQPVMARQGLAVSFEMRELEPEVKFNHGNLRERQC
jgi:5-carboxymethyl-2-hydroxymuconate isomerase